jgi:hypothetical protein
VGYVSPEYFAGSEPFADFIVHEAAHIFHNCKRRMVGEAAAARNGWKVILGRCDSIRRPLSRLSISRAT